jgi:hypothetical protein
MLLSVPCKAIVKSLMDNFFETHRDIGQRKGHKEKHYVFFSLSYVSMCFKKKQSANN